MSRIPIYEVKLVRHVRDGSRSDERIRVQGPADAAGLLREIFDRADREHFIAMLLDTQNRLIGVHTVAIGSLDTCVVHPREVFKAAILANAATILLAHNHPSGDLTPSPSDRAITQQLVHAGKLLDINVCDHIIVGDGARFCSFLEAGLLVTAFSHYTSTET